MLCLTTNIFINKFTFSTMHLLYIAEVLANFTSSDALPTSIGENIPRVLDTHMNSSSYKDTCKSQNNRNLVVSKGFEPHIIRMTIQYSYITLQLIVMYIPKKCILCTYSF